MESESNRQKSQHRGTAEAYRATLARLAAHFPESTVIGDGTLADVLKWQRGDGPGRRFAIDPADFPRLRANARAELSAANPLQRPTRQQIADKLGINVRTLYAYDHRPAMGAPGVAISITTPAFKIEVGRRGSTS